LRRQHEALRKTGCELNGHTFALKPPAQNDLNCFGLRRKICDGEIITDLPSACSELRAGSEPEFFAEIEATHFRVFRERERHTLPEDAPVGHDVSAVGHA